MASRSSRDVAGRMRKCWESISHLNETGNEWVDGRSRVQSNRASADRRAELVRNCSMTSAGTVAGHVPAIEALASSASVTSAVRLPSSKVRFAAMAAQSNSAIWVSVVANCFFLFSYLPSAEASPPVARKPRRSASFAACCSRKAVCGCASAAIKEIVFSSSGQSLVVGPLLVLRRLRLRIGHM